jgi:hypothetical protein
MVPEAIVAACVAGPRAMGADAMTIAAGFLFCAYVFNPALE